MPFERLPGMDVRGSADPALASARRWLARVNARHPWNHNEHFHGWILRNLPARRRAAVDVGCGTGMLAGKPAGHFARVTGIDADAGMAAAASARLDDDPGVTIRRCGFEEFGTAACDGEADLITMVAVLHHLDLDDTLARIPELLAPGGRLLVVGLARVNSLPDLAVDLVSAAANPVTGLIKHPRPPAWLKHPQPASRSCQSGIPALPWRRLPQRPEPTSRAPPSGGACSSATPCAGTSHRCPHRRQAPAPQPGNHQAADRPTPRETNTRPGRAGTDSPGQLRAAGHRACPLLVGAPRTLPPIWSVRAR